MEKTHKLKKSRSPKHKIKKGQVIIYNAAGVPVACYDNMPSPKRYKEHRVNSVEDKRGFLTDGSVKSDTISRGNFRVIRPTREEAMHALNARNHLSSASDASLGRKSKEDGVSGHEIVIEDGVHLKKSLVNDGMPYQQHLVEQLIDVYRKE